MFFFVSLPYFEAFSYSNFNSYFQLQILDSMIARFLSLVDFKKMGLSSISSVTAGEQCSKWFSADCQFLFSSLPISNGPSFPCDILSSSGKHLIFDWNSPSLCEATLMFELCGRLQDERLEKTSLKESS